MAVRNIEVHRAHCCRFHGCKYGAEDCPVVSGGTGQFYPCEVCRMYGILTIGPLKKRPHRGRVLRDERDD